MLLPWLAFGVTGSALDPARPLSEQAHRIWQTEDGLLQDTVTALLESRDGFLWVGTEAGLVRFDGATFDHYSRITDPAFEHNEVQCIANGQGGALWIGTSEPGLYRLERGVFHILGAADGLPNQPIVKLLRDRQGTLWAAPAQGPLLRFDGTRFQPVPSTASQLRIRALSEDPDGSIWVGTTGAGLWRLREGHLVLAALTSDDITALEAGGTEDVWVGTRSHGLLQLHEGRLETPAWCRGLPARAVRTLLLDREGSLWIGLEQAGLYRRRPNGLLEASLNPFGAHWTPISLLEDTSGALWSGSEDRGLRVLFPVPFKRIPVVGADPEEPAWNVCQDTQGTVWCLTGDLALGRVQKDHVDRVSTPLGSPISCLWPRRAGGLWIGTRKGDLFAMDQGRFVRLSRTGWPQADTILSLFEDPQSVLWVSTVRQGLLKLVPGQAPVLFPAEGNVLAMAGNGSGPLYLASRTRGLGILEAGQVRWLGRAEGLGSSGVLSLHLDDENTLWVGTADGPRVFREGRFQDLPQRTGPLLLAIHAILEDSAHRIWLSTGQGVFQIPRAALLRQGDKTRPLQPVVFDHHDGMPSRETNRGAQPVACLTREGDFYFPTSRGLARLDAQFTTPKGPPLRLHILKAESDETVLPDAHPIEVPPGTHKFEVYYTATSLTRADKVRFRYRLEGWENTWNEVGDRRFSAFSNVAPGTYRFVVQAWRLDEHAPERELSVPVVVLPFIYQRPVFWIACTLLAGAFGWWLVRLRVQQVEARSAGTGRTQPHGPGDP